ncbi:MAG: hypothetical protein ACXWT7_02835 [Methylophilaceae bacterium]
MPILTIAGKKKADVDAAIGNPTACDVVKLVLTCYYKKGDTTVVFIDNKADRITVEALDQVALAQDVLPALGLKTIPPAFQDARTAKWTHIHGILEITAFQADQRVDYALVKVRTP